ncbi:MAG: glycosyl transferase, WecB/TagA/CpsF family [Rubrobacteraceae bacterium]|nr:glycosyl transferase, WecB/TagA/CpsF family [Rubrobacteraceae bacterium]
MPVREKINVLGVGVDPLTVEELHERMLAFVENGDRALVLHANAHGLNLACRDERLRGFLNGAQIVFCDGAGVMLAARLLGRRIPERITYADWAWKLAAFAEERGFSLFFLGARPGVAEKAARRLVYRFPKLRIAGAEHGYFDRTPGSAENEAVIKKINAARPDVLLVGFGMPLQELWLAENWEKVDANVALTGGAVFDYVSGELRRGPPFLTDHGLESVARLMVEPRRMWRRYVVGNPLFLLRVLKQRLGRGAARRA